MWKICEYNVFVNEADTWRDALMKGYICYGIIALASLLSSCSVWDNTTEVPSVCCTGCFQLYHCYVVILIWFTASKASEYGSCEYKSLMDYSPEY